MQGFRYLLKDPLPSPFFGELTFPKIDAYLFEGPYYKDYSSFGALLLCTILFLHAWGWVLRGEVHGLLGGSGGLFK